MDQVPSPEILAELAAHAVRVSMAPVGASHTGSLKSGPGEWATLDVAKDPTYHYVRAIRHLCTARCLETGTQEDSEGELSHLQKAVCRSVMAYWLALQRVRGVDAPGKP